MITSASIKVPADLKPKTIASMHGSTYVGDGESAILDLAQAMKDVYG